MRKCDNPTCTGHLAKFDDCRAEALYVASLDSADETTGTTDYRGHFALLIMTEAETLPVDDGVTVEVPAGNYVVQSHDSGAISLITFDTEAEARALMDSESDLYGEWDDQD